MAPFLFSASICEFRTTQCQHELTQQDNITLLHMGKCLAEEINATAVKFSNIHT